MNILSRLLLLYQLENYEGKRFLRLVYSRPRLLWAHDARQKLVWTMKMRALVAMTVLLGVAVGLVWQHAHDPGWASLAYVAIKILLLPVLLVAANTLLWPLDRYLKRRILARASARIETLRARGTRFVAIAGSYGKTSQKEILAHVLSSGLRVFAPSGTLNTPLGISQALDTLAQDDVPDVFVTEMGEHYRGDIDELSRLVRPDIGIITGITHQHLDRMGSMANIIDTIFELPLALAPEAVWYADRVDAHIAEGLAKHAGHIRARSIIIDTSAISDYRSLDAYEGGEWTYGDIALRTRLLGRHIVRPVAVAVEVARSLGLPDETIVAAVASLPYVEHRLQVLRNPSSGVIVVDDSYNGNPESIRATAALARATRTDGRKMLLTPGLVELGEESDAIHRALGREIADAYDLVLLIDTPSSRSLAAGLAEVGYPADRVITYPDTATAHREFSKLLKSGDVVIFQNDWTDNYF